MAQNTAIQVTGLRKVYRSWRQRTVALHGLDLTVPRGSVTGLVGANGSGKTTTLKLLLGLLRPTAGSITLLGGSPKSPAIRARLGFLPEHNTGYDMLSGRQAVDLTGRLKGIPRAERRRQTDQLLERVDMAEAADRKLAACSKGMVRRVGLAQALIGQPELLLLDEPTSGFDPLGIRWFCQLVRELREQGVTVLLCSHMLGQVEAVCDRVALLHRGQLIRSGQELLAAGAPTGIRIHGLLPEEVRHWVDRLQHELPEAAVVEGASAGLEQLFLDTVDGLEAARRAEEPT